jgi:hypothetical protein
MILPSFFFSFLKMEEQIARMVAPFVGIASYTKPRLLLSIDALSIFYMNDAPSFI